MDPSSNPNYIESGQGMGATITMSDEKKAYCLTDRGTWLKMKTDASLAMELDIICEGDKNLFKPVRCNRCEPGQVPGCE